MVINISFTTPLHYSCCYIHKGNAVGDLTFRGTLPLPIITVNSKVHRLKNCLSLNSKWNLRFLLLYHECFSYHSHIILPSISWKTSDTHRKKWKSLTGNIPSKQITLHSWNAHFLEALFELICNNSKHKTMQNTARWSKMLFQLDAWNDHYSVSPTGSDLKWEERCGYTAALKKVRYTFNSSKVITEKTPKHFVKEQRGWV